jgi:RHS repeat-associated protein
VRCLEPVPSPTGAETKIRYGRHLHSIDSLSFWNLFSRLVWGYSATLKNVVAYRSSTARGQPTTWSAYGNRFMFTGREYFPELGLYDFRNRFYYPALGRFLQSDPTGFDAGDANLFRYCGGDPINGSDPFGLHDLGDDWEIAAWNAATTERVVVKGNPTYDILFAENPFADPTRFTTAGLFDRWSNASLQDYYSNSTHEFGLRESSADFQFTSPNASVPANPFAGSPVVTYFTGQSYNGIIGFGGTVTIGSYHSTNGQFGTFVSYGRAMGANIGMAVIAGYINGGPEVFRGQYKNISFGATVVTGSGHFDTSGNYLGASGGVQLPGFTFDKSDTNTILFPDVSLVGEYRRPDGSVGFRDGPRF